MFENKWTLIKTPMWSAIVIQCIIKRAKKMATKYAMAVITIQRFWRNSGAFLKAVQEVLGLKRLMANIFKNAESVHELMLQIAESSKSFFYRQRSSGWFSNDYVSTAVWLSRIFCIISC